MSTFVLDFGTGETALRARGHLPVAFDLALKEKTGSRYGASS